MSLFAVDVIDVHVVFCKLQSFRGNIDKASRFHVDAKGQVESVASYIDLF